MNAQGEIIHAEDQGSPAAQVGVWSESASNCGELFDCAQHGGRVCAAGAGGGVGMAVAGGFG